jgi:protein SCO1/2
MTRNARLLALVALAAVLTLAGVAAITFLDGARLPRVAGAITGKALVGGPFRLTAQDGRTVSDADFRGKYMLVLFGYTFCPDVCPAELQVASAALQKLGPKADRIQPIFITIDPERDTAAVLKDYMANFDPHFLGLTGSPEAIAGAARAYRVYYARAKDDGSGGGGQDYLMDHTSIMYLMGPNGDFVKHFPYGTDPDALAAGLSAAIGR